MGEGGHPVLEHRGIKVFQKGKLVPQNEKVKKKALASHDILQFLNLQIAFLPPSAKRKAINKKITIWLPKTGPINQFSEPQLTSQETPNSFPQPSLTASWVLPVSGAAPAPGLAVLTAWAGLHWSMGLLKSVRSSSKAII